MISNGTLYPVLNNEEIVSGTVRNSLAVAQEFHTTNFIYWPLDSKMKQGRVDIFVQHTQVFGRSISHVCPELVSCGSWVSVTRDLPYDNALGKFTLLRL